MLLILGDDVPLQWTSRLLNATQALQYDNCINSNQIYIQNNQYFFFKKKFQEKTKTNRLINMTSSGAGNGVQFSCLKRHALLLVLLREPSYTNELLVSNGEKSIVGNCWPGTAHAASVDTRPWNVFYNINENENKELFNVQRRLERTTRRVWKNNYILLVVQWPIPIEELDMYANFQANRKRKNLQRNEIIGWRRNNEKTDKQKKKQKFLPIKSIRSR